MLPKAARRAGRVVLGIDGSGAAHVELLRLLFLAGVTPDPDRAPVDLKKDMDKFCVEDIPRYTSYPAVVRNYDPAVLEASVSESA